MIGSPLLCHMAFWAAHRVPPAVACPVGLLAPALCVLRQTLSWPIAECSCGHFSLAGTLLPGPHVAPESTVPPAKCAAVPTLRGDRGCVAVSSGRAGGSEAQAADNLQAGTAADPGTGRWPCACMHTCAHTRACTSTLSPGRPEEQPRHQHEAEGPTSPPIRLPGGRVGRKGSVCSPTRCPHPCAECAQMPGPGRRRVFVPCHTGTRGVCARADTPADARAPPSAVGADTRPPPPAGLAHAHL